MCVTKREREGYVAVEKAKQCSWKFWKRCPNVGRQILNATPIIQRQITHSPLLPLLFPHQLINICTAKGKVYYRCWRGQCKGPRLLSLKTPSCIVWNWGGHILAWSNGHALSYHTANLRIPKYKRKTKTDNQLSFTGWEWVWRLHWFSLFELWTRKTLSCNISQGG